LAARYGKARRSAGITVDLPSGQSIHLSPGAHNALQARVLEEFVPRFAAGARLLYLGDTDLKSKVLETDGLSRIGFPISKHDKLPDLVVLDEKRSWLFLIEVVTSHGPVSAKRYVELEELLTTCSSGRVYVSAFPTFREFKQHASEIAWETEVWVAEFPDHLLHYNGDRFLGPRH
jgi:type II restriction enzyme